MSNSFSNTLKNLPDLARYALLLLVIFLISLMFPNHARFPYAFEKGLRWHYDDLYAPFDFGIKKSEEELAQERKEIENQIPSYYEINAQVVRRKKQEFKKAFEEQLTEVESGGQYVDVTRRSDRYIRFADRFIENVYGKGIIQLTDKDKVKGDKFVVQLREGNTTSKRTLQSFMKGGKAAENWVPDSLFVSRLSEADFLIPLFENFFTPNVFYNDTLTAKFRTEQLSQIVPTHGMVKSGELIISNGNIVTDDLQQTLLSFQDQYEQDISADRSWLIVYFGYLLLTALVVMVFMFYLQIHAPLISRKFSTVLFMVMWLLVYCYAVYVVEQSEFLSAYMIPFCIAPLVIRIFFNERLALMTHLVIVLLASFMSTLGYEFAFLQILAGIVAILTPFDVRSWGRFFQSMLLIFLAYGLGFLGLSLIDNGSYMDIEWSVYRWFSINVFLTLLAYPLVPLLERFFGFLSPFTLVELSDMNTPLLRELSIKAPGTLQHSLQVANLAEAAAAKIKANTLLVKVAALYHDIGKMKHSGYFIENKTAKNPHDIISEKESAKIIINHVTHGVELAKKAGLPTLLVDFIKTHHGTTRVEYFYRNHCAKLGVEKAEDADFRYPGPRPRTKEEAILMMADSLEAAAKSLKEPTMEAIDQLVEKVIAGKVAHRQLDNTALSFRELEMCKSEFKKLLKSIYHGRIEYPEEG
ncbi:MAG: HD family phosphohydrolase [Saprospiraceae bacterium]